MDQGEKTQRGDCRLDLRGMSRSERQASLRQGIDELGARDRLTLVVDEDPRNLLQELRAERTGFQWHVLESKRDTFRFEVTRLEDDGSRRVSEHLGADRDRLDALFQETRQLASEGQFEASIARFEEFACGLDQHIDAEEFVLFPAFEKMTGMRGEPTETMRTEHMAIRLLLGSVRAAIGRHDAPAVERWAAEVLDVLGAHNVKEEEMVYPMTDKAADGDDEREELVRLIEAV